HPDHDDGRPRHRQGHHRRAEHRGAEHAGALDLQRIRGGPAGGVPAGHRAGGGAVPGDPAQRTGHDDRSDRDQPASEPDGRDQTPRAAHRGVHPQCPDGRCGRYLLHCHGDDRGRLPDRVHDGARRHPGSGDRRGDLGRRPVLDRWFGGGCDLDRDAEQDRSLPRRVFLGDTGLQGRRDRDPGPVAIRSHPSPVRPASPPEGAGSHEEGGAGMSAVKAPEEARPSTAQRLLTVVQQRWELHRNTLPTAAAVVIFVVMIGYGEFSYGRIVQLSTLSNLLINNAHLIIMAVGAMLPILTGRGGIDLSVGSIIAFSGLSGVMLANAGLPLPLVIIVMLGCGTVSGTISGTLIQYFNVQPFIATLAMMFLGRGLASILSTQPVRLAEGTDLAWLSTSFKVIDGPKVNDLV